MIIGRKNGTVDRESELVRETRTFDCRDVHVPHKCVNRD